ncbi:dehydrogenase/reductase [Auriculariales sp. MPI-PUGE-AT-0066]|nr:dehydrogenase/reductase [Auriculariales sp. MPI-PUGE-AT-0066]
MMARLRTCYCFFLAAEQKARLNNFELQHPDYFVVIASRSGGAAADKINKELGRQSVAFSQLDLMDLHKVRVFAEDWLSKADGGAYAPIQSLVLNAGLQFPGPLSITDEGLEKTFSIVVGHALLFHLLSPCLADHARVIVTSSGTHDPEQKTGLPPPVYSSAEELAHPIPPSNIPGRQRYSTAKLCTIMWTYVLQRRLDVYAKDRHIVVHAFDPGLMPGTGLAREATAIERFAWNRVMPKAIGLMRVAISRNIWLPQESGAHQAWLAVSEEYFEAKREIKSSKLSYDEAKQEDLWKWIISYCSRDPVERTRFEELKPAGYE